MTAREMQRKVEQRLMLLEIDPLKLKSQDIFDGLNASVHQFISDRVDSIRKNNADNFSAIQKELDDLRLIIKQSNPLSGVAVGTRKQYTIPTEYRHLISAKAETSKLNCSAVYRKIRIYSQEIIDEVNEERLYRPTIKSPTGSLIGDKLNIYFDSKFSLGNALVTYIENPAIIGIGNTSGVLTQTNCSLALHTHEDIVELAVQYTSRVLNVNNLKQNQT